MDRRLLITGAALAAGALARPAAAQGDAGPAGVADRFAAALSAHDIPGFAALFAEGYVNHQTSAAAPAPPPGKSPKQATVDFFAARLAGMPDLQVSVETVVAAADKVAASFVYVGTHATPFFGVAPTGRRLRFTSCDIFLVRDGLLTEHWGMGDVAGILAQLRA